jgi:hypothetical protein
MYLGGKTARKSKPLSKRLQLVNKSRKRSQRKNITKKLRLKYGVGRGAYLKGWAEAQPTTHERTVMQKSCGPKCFLGPNNSFPICRRHTCKVDRRGLAAAYVRAREYMTIKGEPKYKRIAKKAKRKLYF